MNTKQKNATPILKVKELLKNAPSLRIIGSNALSQKGFQSINHSCGDHHVKLGEYAARLYKDKSMTDVLVVVQSKEFKAHKAVLACHSPYFNEVLNQPGVSNVHYLQLPSVTAKAFEIILDYIYTGELRVTCQELSEVYRAAKRLGIEDAVARCVNLLQVNEENFQNMVYLYVTSRKLELLDASARGLRLMVLNFEKLITTREFLDLEVDQIIELFSCDELGARSESIVFIAALKWLDYDFFAREEYAERVMDCVRFPLMTREEIMACYHPPLLPGLMVMPRIRESLLKATCYITAKALGQEALFSDLEAKPRKFLFGGEPMILWDVSLFDAEKYQDSKKHNAAINIQALFRGYMTRKRLMEEMYIANYAAAVIQSVYRGYRVRKSLRKTKSAMQWKGRSPKSYLFRTDNRSGVLKAYTKRTFEELRPDAVDEAKNMVVYAMGAFDAEKAEPNSLFEFDTVERSWKFLTKCLAPRYDARLVILDGYLYIVGGFNPVHRTESGVMMPLRECHRYHIETGEWREMPEMEVARCSHAVEVYNGEILALGGKNDQNILLRAVERYDMEIGRWKDFSHFLPEPRMAMGCTVHKKELWIAGGITSDGQSIFVLDSVWCLDRFSRWNKKPNLPQALAFPTLISDRNNLFCVGGATRPMCYEKEELESVDKIYMLLKGRWVDQQPMPFQCHNVIACNVDKHLYVFGGFSSHTMSHVSEPVFINLEEDKTEKLFVPNEAEGYIVEATVLLQKQGLE